MADTRQKQKQAFTHLFKEVLICTAKSPLWLAMEKENIDSIIDVLSLTETDLAELTYEEVSGSSGIVSTTETRVEKKLPLKDRKLLLHVLWWRDMLASTRSDGNVTTEDWLNLKAEEFDQFRLTVAANRARGGTKSESSSSAPGVVTTSRVDKFLSNIKLEVTQYPKFDGSIDKWLPFKRRVTALARTHGMS